MGQLAAGGFLQALTDSYDKRLGLVCDESLLAAALHRDFLFGLRRCVWGCTHWQDRVH